MAPNRNLAGAILAVLVASGCDSSRGLDPNSFSLTQVTTSLPVELSGRLDFLESSPKQFDPVFKLTNSTVLKVNGGYGACAWGARVRRGSSADGPIVWQNLPAKDAACPEWYSQFAIDPNRSFEIPLGRITGQDLLAALSHGSYFMTGVINLNGAILEVPLGTFTL